MAQDLIEKLNDLARAFADAQNAQYTSNLTRSRGRVLAVQWTLFNRNRRDCWGERRPFPIPAALQTVVEELSPKEPKAKSSKFEDFVDLRALREVEREGGLR